MKIVYSSNCNIYRFFLVIFMSVSIITFRKHLLVHSKYVNLILSLSVHMIGGLMMIL